MRVRALVALAFAWVIVAAVRGRRRAGERQDRAEARPGAGPADAEPVHRPGRGGLPRLGDQLRPPRQLQPEGPQPGPRHRQELDDLAGQEDDHLQAVREPQVVRRAADHLEGRQVQLRDVRAQQPAVRQLRREHQQDRHAGRPDRGHPHQAPGRADRRRPVRLHPARAHLGQGAGQEAHRLLPADAAARRQRALHRLRVPARAADPDDPQPELHGQEAGVRRGPVDQVRQQRRRRPRAHAR